MTLLVGEKYIVETLEQFINRTAFTYVDVLAASDEDWVAYHNERAETEVTALADVPASLHAEYASMVERPIVPTLAADSRPWVHLYDGIVHTIVQVHQQSIDEVVRDE